MDIITLIELYFVAIMIGVGAKIATWLIDKDDDDIWKQ